ncbi:MAG TPA: hypothetical protein VFF65_09260, partial [Phycisphaerales bacterium]|nr:hypothetical protein [Phycisphaerales bacterium]
DKTIGAYAKNQGQVRKVLSTTVKAVEGMRHTFTNVITGLQIENFLDGVNDPTYGTSADETLTPGQEAKRRQFESAFHSRMKSLGRSPTPRDVARALRAARASVDAPQAREAAVKDIHSKIEKRAKHAGAVPRNGKPGAPQPKKSVEHAARVADRFLSGDAGKGKGKK